MRKRIQKYKNILIYIIFIIFIYLDEQKIYLDIR